MVPATWRLRITVCLALASSVGCAQSTPSSDSSDNPSEQLTQEEPSPEQEIPHLDDGGEFEDIHHFAEYLSTQGLQCVVEYELGDGGRCLFDGRPANVFFEPDIPLLYGQTLKDFKKSGIDSFVIGWNWRVDTGYEAIAKAIKRVLPGADTLFL